MKHLTAGIVCAALVASCPVAADMDPVRINSMVLGEGLQLVEESGFYADAARDILNIWGGDFVYNVSPFKRAVRNFRSGASDCIWALDLALLRDLGVDASSDIESDALLVSKQRIFTRQGEPVISSLEALKGKRVGVLIGTNLETELQPIDAVVVELNNQEAKLAVLNLHRVDAILGWMPDIAITAHLKALPLPEFDRSFVVRTAGVGFVCHDTEVGRTFLAEVKAAIKAYRTSTDFEALKVRYLGLSHSSFGI